MSIIIFVMVLVSAPGLVKNGIAGADSAGSGISCGHDSLCNTLADKDFEMILYSATGSEMVVLFSKNEIGDIVPRVPESYYSRAAGTVKDAIYYLSRNHNYAGFKFRPKNLQGYSELKSLREYMLLFPSTGHPVNTDRLNTGLMRRMEA
jgi:hypothetical protein